MRAIKPNTRRRALWRTVLLALLAIVIGGAGTVTALAMLKMIDPAKLAFWRSGDAIPKDYVSVPVCAKLIPAYSLVGREYLLDPRKPNQFLVDYLSPKALSEFVARGGITKVSELSGRVTSRDKEVGYFYESDFLPKGTHPGVAGGTPPGKLAITLDASKLKGVVYDLKAGDHVVLQSSTAVDMPGAGHSSGGRFGSNVVATPNMTLLPKRSLVTTLVEDGVVVTPARTRLMPISSTSLTQGMTTRTVPVQEIVIAVDPQEVAPLDEAIDLKYEITCIARSGRPSSHVRSAANQAGGGQPAAPAKPANVGAGSSAGSAAASILTALLLPAVQAAREKARHAVSNHAAETTVNSKAAATAGRQGPSGITPGLDPLARIRFMEVMIGPQRQFMLFNGPGNSPVVAIQDDGSAKAGSAVAPSGAVEESKQ